MSSIILILKKIKKIIFLDIDFFCYILFDAMREMRVQIPRWPATVKLSCKELTKSECLIVKNNRVECTILWVLSKNL